MRYYSLVLIVTVGLLGILANSALNAKAIDFEISNPFVSKEWKIEQATLPDKGYHYCILSAGHNAIEVIFRKDKSGIVNVGVKSTRKMIPGTNFYIRVNKNQHHSVRTYFSEKQSRKIIQDFQEDDIAYLEWREADIGRSGRNRWTSRIKLHEFKELYQQCKNYL